MSVLRTSIFEHAGRAFEIRAETYADPTYVEAVVFENGSPATVTYPGGLSAMPTYGANFHRELGPEDAATIDALIAGAESEFRRLTPLGVS